jgi:hypothetical protein
VGQIDPNWDGSYVRVVAPDIAEEPIAMIRFVRCMAFMFGPPNDEAFRGHPLAGRGLRPYAVFEVQHSSWIRQLEQMNSVHPHHRPKAYTICRHFIFAFHDSTFECIANGFEVSLYRSSMKLLLPKMEELLKW